MRQSLQTLESAYEAAKATMGDELERFAENTLEYMRRERHLILDSPDLPDLAIDLAGRHVLIVVRGNDYKDDLDALRNTLRPGSEARCWSVSTVAPTHCSRPACGPT